MPQGVILQIRLDEFGLSNKGVFTSDYRRMGMFPKIRIKNLYLPKRKKGKCEKSVPRTKIENYAPPPPPNIREIHMPVKNVVEKVLPLL